MTTEKKMVPALRFHFLTRWFDLFLAFTFPEKKMKQALINQCGFDSPNRIKVLDFGCGTLTLSIMAKEQYPDLKITGLDIDENILRIAEKKVSAKAYNIRLDKYNGGRFPYKDNEFSVIYSSLVFHHINDKDKVSTFKEIRRVMSPGAILRIADFGKPKGIYSSLAFAIVRRMDGEKNSRANAYGLLPNLIREAGFVNVTETMSMNTLFGTIVFINAQK